MDEMVRLCRKNTCMHESSSKLLSNAIGFLLNKASVNWSLILKSDFPSAATFTYYLLPRTFPVPCFLVHSIF